MTRLSAEKVPVSLRSERAGFLSLIVSPADGRFQSHSPGLDKPEWDQGIATRATLALPLL